MTNGRVLRRHRPARPAPAAALLSGALFGASYLALTGLCILWAARPARGVTWSFAGLGAGQTAASPPAGAVGSAAGPAAVFGLTGLAALLAWSRLVPRLAPPPS